MKTLAVICDDREKFPLTFSPILYHRPGEVITTYRVVTKPIRLDARIKADTELSIAMPADYFIEGYREVTVIERKASREELMHNLFGSARKQKNFLYSLDQMVAKAKFPYLFMDFRWSDLYTREVWSHERQKNIRVEEQPFAIIDRLLRETSSRRIGIIGPMPARTPGNRRCAGDWVVRTMLAHIFPHPPSVQVHGQVFGKRDDGTQGVRAPKV